MKLIPNGISHVSAMGMVAYPNISPYNGRYSRKTRVRRIWAIMGNGPAYFLLIIESDISVNGFAGIFPSCHWQDERELAVYGPEPISWRILYQKYL